MLFIWLIGGFAACGKIVELIYLSKLMRYNEKIKYTNPTLYKKLN
tara:strand:- start:218 stop:352 length:135 start_codon:yes stop_codon:yes gene_type:complete